MGGSASGPVTRRSVRRIVQYCSVTDLDALLARMTLDEKLAQLGCVWCSA